MAKRAGLPWDCVISAELFGHYKPDPEAYLGCADLLGVRPEELMLVAAHPSDLRAARDVGPEDGVRRAAAGVRSHAAGSPGGRRRIRLHGNGFSRPRRQAGCLKGCRRSVEG